MRGSVVPVVLVLVLVGGCGVVAGDGGGVARGALAASGVPSAGSTGAAFDRNAASHRVKAALIGQRSLVTVGGPAVAMDEDDVGYRTSHYCNLDVVGVSGLSHIAHGRKWDVRGFFVYQTVHGYGNITGAAAVAATSRNAQQCQSYELRYTQGADRVEILDVVDLGQVPGVEAAYGRCVRFVRLPPDNRPPFFSRDAFLARSNLLSNVSVSFGSTVATSKAKLVQIVPIAAEALAAVPG